MPKVWSSQTFTARLMLIGSSRVFGIMKDRATLLPLVGESKSVISDFSHCRS